MVCFSLVTITWRTLRLLTERRSGEDKLKQLWTTNKMSCRLVVGDRVHNPSRKRK